LTSGGIRKKYPRAAHRRQDPTLEARARPIRRWDGGALYLDVSRSGGKLWRLKYRFNGKEKLLALGKWDTVTLREARELRDEWKKILAKGMDAGTVLRKRPSWKLSIGQ